NEETVTGIESGPRFAAKPPARDPVIGSQYISRAKRRADLRIECAPAATPVAVGASLIGSTSAQVRLSDPTKSGGLRKTVRVRCRSRTRRWNATSHTALGSWQTRN